MRRRDFLKRSVVGGAMMIGSQPFTSIACSEVSKHREAGIKTRFAIASDGHYGQAETSFDQFHNEMMNWLNLEHERNPLDFCLFNGDLIHDDPNLYPDLKKIFGVLKMPYHISRGNHDRCSAETWEGTWGKSLNYSFTLNDAGFVVLDTSNINGEYICPDVSWTRNELKRFESAKHVFVFMHITPFKWTENGINCDPLVKVFEEQKNLKAIFHGHDHDQDHFKLAVGKHYFFDSHMGGSWGTEYRGYRIVEITHDENILTYQVNPTAGLCVNRDRL